MAWHVILCSIGYIDVPNNGIEQACSWTSCDTHKKYLVIDHEDMFYDLVSSL